MSKWSSTLQCVCLWVLTIHPICAYQFMYKDNSFRFLFQVVTFPSIWLVEIEVLKLKGRSLRQWREGKITDSHDSPCACHYWFTLQVCLYICTVYIIEGDTGRERESRNMTVTASWELENFVVGTWKAFFLENLLYSFIFVKWRGMRL